MAASVKKHKERAHALLSASSASRWLNCTPSARLEEQAGERPTSVFAEEGTLAHELSELLIRHNVLQEINEAEFNEGFIKITSNDLYNNEMLEAARNYADFCNEEFAAARMADKYAIMEIEQRIDFSRYVPDGFGTADCIIIADDKMEVIDLKYGKGVPVNAVENNQLMLYGLGALLKYDTVYPVRHINLAIVQPRLGNYSTWAMDVDDLYKWAEQELRPKAQLAYAGLGELNAGSWCKFCNARNRCRRLYEQQLDIAKYDFKTPDLLTDEEIADVVKRTPSLVEWANYITDWAQSEAVNNGKHWPGLKVVEGASRRKWADEDKAPYAILERFPGVGADDVYAKKMKPITAIEKLVGKKNFAEKLSDLVVKPQGKPTLVPEDDTRPEISSYSAAVSDFS